MRGSASFGAAGRALESPRRQARGPWRGSDYEVNQEAATVQTVAGVGGACCGSVPSHLVVQSRAVVSPDGPGLLPASSACRTVLRHRSVFERRHL